MKDMKEWNKPAIWVCFSSFSTHLWYHVAILGMIDVGVNLILGSFFRELELYGQCMGNSPTKYGYADMWEYEPTSSAIVLKDN